MPSSPKRSDIIFVPLPSQRGALPYAFLALASYLNAKTGRTARILDIDQPADFEKVLIERLVEEKPRCVGLACYTPTYAYVLRLAALIKKHIDCRIIVGNAHASLYPEDFFFENSPVDYAVIGEGELSLAELLDALAQGREPVNIPGVALAGPDGKMLRGEKRALISDLSILPQVDYGLIDMKPYLSFQWDFRWNMPILSATVFASRGCPSACEFCAANTVWRCNTGVIVRFRPLGDVMAEITYIKEKYRVQGVWFCDDSFFSSKKRVLDFCALMEGKGLFWAAQGNVTQLDEEMIIAMKKAGFLVLAFGVESGSDAILTRINKRQTVERIAATFDLCHKHGIRCIADIMCNHPGETEEDIRLTGEMIRRIRPNKLSLSVVTPYPGSLIYEKYVNPKITRESYGIFSGLGGPRTVEHFKLCAHSLPMLRVFAFYSWCAFRFQLPGSVSIFFASAPYRRMLIAGGYCWKYTAIALPELAFWLRSCLIELIPSPIKTSLKEIRNAVHQWLLRTFPLAENSRIRRLMESVLGTPN